MQSLRQQVDRTDLKILHLLQQRIKLSSRIGEVKRRHGAPVYVPQREGELRARIAKLSKGKLPPRAVAAIYREILSNSRAIQGQKPLGLLRASAGNILLSARWQFGACDEFQTGKNWAELVRGLSSGKLTLALLTGDDLTRILRTPQGRRQFQDRFMIAGDFSPTLESKVSLRERIWIVMPRSEGVTGKADRIVILIECKSTVNTVKNLVNSMSDRSIHAEQLPLRAGSTSALLVRLTLAQRIDTTWTTARLLTAGKLAGHSISLLGVYPGTENYGG